MSPELNNHPQENISDVDTIQHTPPHIPDDLDAETRHTTTSPSESENKIIDTDTDDSTHTEPVNRPPVGSFRPTKHSRKPSTQTIETVTRLEFASMQHSMRK